MVKLSFTHLYLVKPSFYGSNRAKLENLIENCEVKGSLKVGQNFLLMIGLTFILQDACLTHILWR